MGNLAKLEEEEGKDTKSLLRDQLKTTLRIGPVANVTQIFRSSHSHTSSCFEDDLRLSSEMATGKGLNIVNVTAPACPRKVLRAPPVAIRTNSFALDVHARVYSPGTCRPSPVTYILYLYLLYAYISTTVHPYIWVNTACVSSRLPELIFRALCSGRAPRNGPGRITKNYTLTRVSRDDARKTLVFVRSIRCLTNEVSAYA